MGEALTILEAGLELSITILQVSFMFCQMTAHGEGIVSDIYKLNVDI